jgi:hypothetical protein
MIHDVTEVHISHHIVTFFVGLLLKTRNRATSLDGSQIFQRQSFAFGSDLEVVFNFLPPAMQQQQQQQQKSNVP